MLIDVSNKGATRNQETAHTSLERNNGDRHKRQKAGNVISLYLFTAALWKYPLSELF